MTTNADLERLCNALALTYVFYLFPREVDLGDQSPADALFWCETKEEAQADIDRRCPPGAWIWEGPAPVATDDYAARKAMEAACRSILPTKNLAGTVALLAHSFEIFPPVNADLWEVLFDIEAGPKFNSEGDTFPAAVFGALLQALDAGAFGINTKGETNESR